MWKVVGLAVVGCDSLLITTVGTACVVFDPVGVICRSDVYRVVGDSETLAVDRPDVGTTARCVGTCIRDAVMWLVALME